MTESTFDLVFVTAGELPLTTSLHASQVIEPAISMIRQGHSVEWFAAVPFLSYWKDAMLGGAKLRAVKQRCDELDIRFDYVVSPLSIAGTFSFLFRRPVLRHAAARIASRLAERTARPTVFHARSYYAAHLACEIRTITQADGNWRVSFDMRSVLPEEFPLTQGWVGRACFGFAKQWEHELLGKCDVAFLPLDYARERYARESGFQVVHAPIQGFDRPVGWSPDFARRWQARRIGYAGSIAAWHDPDLLREMLALVPGGHATLAMPAHPQLQGLECREYKHAEMAGFYDGLLALVVPGRKDSADYFVSFKMRCNFFSTKAAEALSLGVPLIVSSHLVELADFVRKHDCGAIYDPDLHQIVHPPGDWLTDEAQWSRLSENAKVVGEMFTRASVMELYRRNWSALF